MIPEYLLCRKLCMTYFVDRLHGLWPYAISTKLCGSALRVTSNILFKYFLFQLSSALHQVLSEIDGKSTYEGFVANALVIYLHQTKHNMG